MNANAPAENEDIRTKLNRETAKISWEELQRFYAAGSVVVVSAELDLIVVAELFSTDNSAAVTQLLESGGIVKADDRQAELWHQQQANVWAVVVAPWVLVQAVK
ncbi:DUF2288 domain-containing protein [Oceanicoccus sp. KOV_DT_Chl]|uniref:DUF2288 domain-containing protein n=1 Tax=Oceanicoccus sp. KOV_DT_Chl TaxID=1904639 RepID=UPI001F440BDD|nr:DUF2288 family protein [Oceanicoccus sp. KOV_DT_Chl]